MNDPNGGWLKSKNNSYLWRSVHPLPDTNMKIRLFTLPNLLTLSNLLCGTIATAVVFTRGDLRLAFWLLVLAAAFDFFDGFTARLLRQSSPIGLQLDSLADMVSSGVAPAAVMLTLARQADTAWWAADTQALWSWGALLLTVGAALRLAKFNVDDSQRTEFCGLPSPAAGLFCASLGLLRAEGLLALPCEAVLLAAVVTAWLMISPIRMFALKFHGFGWADNRLRYLFLGTCVVLIFCLRAYAIPAIIVLYVAVSLVRWLVQGRRATEA